MSHATVRSHEDAILEALRNVIDPELGINIVDLGLVYGAGVLPNGEIHVEMTMTTPMCPLSSHLLAEAKAVLRSAFPTSPAIKIHLVWEPVWDPSMMSAAARKQMGWGR